MAVCPPHARTIECDRQLSPRPFHRCVVLHESHTSQAQITISVPSKKQEFFISRNFGQILDKFWTNFAGHLSDSVRPVCVQFST